MGYNISYRKPAEKELYALPLSVQKRIVGAIDKLPFEGDVVPLEGRTTYRLRVGSYRIIFERDDTSKTITVRNIGSRGDIYKK